MQVSMTGYGKATVEHKGYRLNVELRSLNSKQLDLSVKLPPLLREDEMGLRAMVAQHLGRGKVELVAQLEATPSSSEMPINTALFAAYVAELRSLAQQNGIGLEGEQLLSTVLRLPDVLRQERTEPDAELQQGLRQALMQAAGQALDALCQFRQREGRALADDLLQRVEAIGQLLQRVETIEKQRLADVKQRLHDAVSTLQQELRPDAARFEQELIFYIEKMDINEEKVRLRQHCQYFVETCTQAPASGRKLGFIAQEMGREINTMGSKANHAELQRLVVMMKDELEKIKEQVFNIL